MWTRATITRCAATLILLAGLGILTQARPAEALELTVSPIQIHLTPTQKSAIIRVGNPNDDAITVQATVFAWTQDANGTDRLTPATDLLAFPQMILIKPGFERLIRVGTTNPDRSVERTFRILLEPVLTPKGAHVDPTSNLRAAAATIITRSSVPIFVYPTKGLPAPIKVAGRVERGALLLQTTNPGTVHVSPPNLTIKGYTANTELLFEHETHAWYILAGGTRTDPFKLPPEHCPRLQRLVVEVLSGQQTETVTVPVSPESCQP
jgi:P pilus assembly chaperone PapD